MAFENIGIGGVLSFESAAAVSSMGRAERAFNSVSRAAARVSAGVGTMGAGFQRLNFMGGGVTALAGLGLGAVVREGMRFNKEMETAQLAIATILATVTKTPLDENINVAANAIQRLNVVAAEAPGELGDMVNIFQLMSGPIVAAGGKMDDILGATKGTAILAGVLKRSFQDTGAAMAKLQAGTVESGNDIIIMLKSMGLIKETTQEWKALLPEQRLKRMKEILATFEESGERVGKTFEATSSTTTSIAKQLAGAFAKSMFDSTTSRLSKINDLFMSNSAAALETARNIGEKVGNAIQFVVEQMVEVGRLMRDVFTFLRAQVVDLVGWLNELGFHIDDQVVGKVVYLIGAFGAMTIAISPVISLVGFLGSRLMGVVQIVKGLLMSLSGIGGLLVGPVGIALAGAVALFVMLRNHGKELGEIFNQMKTLAMSVWAGIQPAIAALKTAFDAIVTMVVNTLEALAPIVLTIIETALGVFEAIRPGLTAVFNAVANVVKVVAVALAEIVPKLIAMLQPLFELLGQVMVKVAAIFSKILKALAPVIDAIARILQDVVFPIIGWLIDVAGPVLEVVFGAVGVILDGILFVVDALASALGFVTDIVGGAFKAAWEAVGFVFEKIGYVIENLIVAPLKWVAEKLGWIVDKVGGAIDAVGDFVGGAIDAVGDFFTTTDEELLALIDSGAWPMVTDQLDATQVAAIRSRVEMKKLAEEAEVTAAIANASLNQVGTDIDKVKQELMNTLSEDDRAKLAAQLTPTVDVNNNIDIKSNLCVNGRNMSVASAKHQTEINERAGFNRTPWQNRRVQISGSQ